MSVLIRDLPAQGVQTIEGTVARRIGDDDFVLRDRSGTILVDVDLDDRRLNVKVGERLTVIGRLDDDTDDVEFEARRITRANGVLVYDRLGSGAASLQDDRLTSGNRADVLNGGGGNDQLLGRGGRDRLIGGDGDDLLDGGLGRDIVTTGAGRDRVVYQTLQERGDRILDFSPDQDVIDVSPILAQPEYGNPRPFETYVRLTQAGANVRVEIDPDGDLGNRGFITLATLVGVSASRLSAQNVSV